MILAGLSGHGELPDTKSDKGKKQAKKKPITQKPSRKKSGKYSTQGNGGSSKTKEDKNIGLTVRIEINLPADGSKDTYDNIFKSIKENLIDG